MAAIFYFHASVLIVFFLFGTQASFQDFKTRRISRNLIRSLLVFLAFSYVFFALLSSHVPGFSRVCVFYESALMNMGLCGACALLLWYRRLWPAGDAKFFTLLSSLIVLINPNIPGFPYWIFMKLLINIFVSASMFIILVATMKLLRNLQSVGFPRLKSEFPIRARQWAGHVKMPKSIFLARFLCNFLILSTLIEFLSSGCSNRLGGILPLMFYLIFYIVWSKLQRLIRSRVFFVLSIALVAVMIVSSRFHLISSLLSGGFFSIGFFVFFWGMRFIEARLRLGRLRAVKIRDLRVGDVLGDKSWDYLSTLCVSSDGSSELLRYADGLFQEDLETIFKCPGLDLDHEAEVYETRPFAFWIFFGAAWTLFAVNTFPHCLASWLGFH